MIMILFASLIAMIVTFTVLIIAWALAKRSDSDREKSSPFECGFDPNGSARLPFSLRFFLLAVIFLIFDVEIVLLFPVISMGMSTLPITPYMMILTFIILLLLGLLHEWEEGSLDWLD